MSDYIRREDAEVIVKYCCLVSDDPGKLIIKNLEKLKTVDVKPVTHGHWIKGSCSDVKDYSRCSECLHTQDITAEMNYCAVCGAKMDAET